MLEWVEKPNSRIRPSAFCSLAHACMPLSMVSASRTEWTKNRSMWSVFIRLREVSRSRLMPLELRAVDLVTRKIFSRSRG